MACYSSSLAPTLSSDTLARGGSASSTVRTSTWSAQRPWTSWTSCFDMTTRPGSLPGRPWSTPTSVSARNSVCPNPAPASVPDSVHPNLAPVIQTQLHTLSFHLFLYFYFLPANTMHSSIFSIWLLVLKCATAPF